MKIMIIYFISYLVITFMDRDHQFGGVLAMTLIFFMELLSTVMLVIQL